MLQVSVIIPFRGDADTLRWVLDGFACQRLPENMLVDVRVGGDGCSLPPAPPVPPDTPLRFSMRTLPRSGVAGAKNLLLQGIQSDVLIFVNGDTRPDVHFIAAHASRLLSLPQAAMVLGSAPYESGAGKTVLDALKEESPMVFFYDQLQPHQSYDYRHAWNLNVSVRGEDVRRIGGFSVNLRPYGYEDLDFAWRLMGTKAAVFYDPAAAVTHRHPMTLDEYLNREEGLGTVAPVLYRVNPTLFQSLFGPRNLDVLAGDYRAWTSMDAASHRWIYQRMTEWCDQPESALGAPGTDERRRLVHTVYQMHIPLKRLAFRLGFLRGLELLDDSQWLQRTHQGLWKQAIS
jgi:N-terminal domain of galactosyltransferase